MIFGFGVFLGALLGIFLAVVLYELFGEYSIGIERFTGGGGSLTIEPHDPDED
jgi:hypothetical protein